MFFPLKKWNIPMSLKAVGILEGERLLTERYSISKLTYGKCYWPRSERVLNYIQEISLVIIINTKSSMYKCSNTKLSALGQRSAKIFFSIPKPMIYMYNTSKLKLAFSLHLFIKMINGPFPDEWADFLVSMENKVQKRENVTEQRPMFLFFLDWQLKVTWKMGVGHTFQGSSG